MKAQMCFCVVFIVRVQENSYRTGACMFIFWGGEYYKRKLSIYVNSFDSSMITILDLLRTLGVEKSRQSDDEPD